MRGPWVPSRPFMYPTIIDATLYNERDVPAMLTVGELARAIGGRLRVPQEAAVAAALTVLSYFGFTSRVLDNTIEPADRVLFHELHDAGLLHPTGDTVLLVSGKPWRIYYWELREGNARRTGAIEVPAREADVYADLPAEAWTSPRSARASTT